jgi:hypothetical protein
VKAKIILLASLLLVSPQGAAWIAYGFQSGMSRFDVAAQVADRGGRVTTEDGRQMYAVSADEQTSYQMLFCSTPQKLYLMRYSPADSPETFAFLLRKYQRRFGEPEGPDDVSVYRQAEAWENADIALIWHVSESETLLLTHDGDGIGVEFQNVSVCW